MDDITPTEPTPETTVDEPLIPLDSQPEVDKTDLTPETPVQTEQEKLLAGIDSVLKPVAKTEDTTVNADEKPVANADEKPTDKLTEEKPVEAAPVEADDKDDDKLEFKDHPRFKSLKSEAAAAKARFTEFEAKLASAATEVQPLHNLRSFLSDSGVTGTEFTEALQIMRALKTDPLQAYKLLEPTIKMLNQHTGKGDLPDDLKAKIVEGEISESFARETVRLRTEADVAKKAAQRTVEITTSADDTRLRNEAMQAVASWEANISKADPEYARRQELTHKLIMANGQGGFRTSAEALTLVNNAYAEATRLLPKVEVAVKPATKAVPTTATSSQGRQIVVTKPKDIHDGVSQVLASVRR